MRRQGRRINQPRIRNDFLQTSILVFRQLTAPQITQRSQPKHRQPRFFLEPRFGRRRHRDRAGRHRIQQRSHRRHLREVKQFKKTINRPRRINGIRLGCAHRKALTPKLVGKPLHFRTITRRLQRNNHIHPLPRWKNRGKSIQHPPPTPNHIRKIGRIRLIKPRRQTDAPRHTVQLTHGQCFPVPQEQIRPQNTRDLTAHGRTPTLGQQSSRFARIHRGRNPCRKPAFHTASIQGVRRGQKKSQPVAQPLQLANK